MGKFVFLSVKLLDYHRSGRAFSWPLFLQCLLGASSIHKLTNNESSQRNTQWM